MYVVNNCSRALLVALVPLATIHAVLTAMALLGTQAAQPGEIPTPDSVLFLYLARVAIDGALLYAGHRVLRRLFISSRLAYALMGGVMAAAGYAIAVRNNFQLDAPTNGMLLTVGLLPTNGDRVPAFFITNIPLISLSETFPPLSTKG